MSNNATPIVPNSTVSSTVQSSATSSVDAATQAQEAALLSLYLSMLSDIQTPSGSGSASTALTQLQTSLAQAQTDLANGNYTALANDLTTAGTDLTSLAAYITVPPAVILKIQTELEGLTLAAIVRQTTILLQNLSNLSSAVASAVATDVEVDAKKKLQALLNKALSDYGSGNYGDAMKDLKEVQKSLRGVKVDAQLQTLQSNLTEAIGNLSYLNTSSTSKGSG